MIMIKELKVPYEGFTHVKLLKYLNEDGSILFIYTNTEEEEMQYITNFNSIDHANEMLKEALTKEEIKTLKL